MATLGLATMNSMLQYARVSLNPGPHFSLMKPFSCKTQKTVNRIFAPKIFAASAPAFVETKPEPLLDDKELGNWKNVFACPICYETLLSSSDFDSSKGSVARSILRCKTCSKDYSKNESHFDLTITSGGRIYGESMPASTELFRLPLVSYLYERGWRQSFSLWGGFPGPEKEFELIKEYLTPVLGGKIIDASCASGVFSRLFAKSGLFSLVFALDFSETMLQQCYEFIKQEENFPREKITLVRADISRLPFSSGTIDAVHAGAALHCWPSPSVAVAEISRVLRPGGRFVATTYLVDGPYSFVPFLRPIRQTVSQVSGSRIFLSEKELEDLFSACGFVDIKFTRNRRFVMIKAAKLD